MKPYLWALALATTQIVGAHASDTASKKHVLLATEVAPADMTAEQAAAKHEVLYADVWADEKGGTHISRCILKGLELNSFAPPASPYYFGLAPEEVQSVLQGRAATYADLPALAYTTRVVKESMRLYPPAWTVERDAVADGQHGAVEP